MVEHIDEDLQGSQFRRVDLSGSRWHGVVLQEVKITDSWIDHVEISGRINRLIVNEVDVTDHVARVLDERHPERRLLAAADAEGVREAWAMIETTAGATVERARALPPAALDESLDDEYSYLQTLRHLVFATDRWISGPVLGDPEPFHRLGQPYDGAEEVAELDLDLDARPSLDDVLEVRRDRMGRVGDLVRGATDDDLARVVASPNGGDTTVLGCIQVVLREEWAHDRYANRDLTLLEASEARRPTGDAG